MDNKSKDMEKIRERWNEHAETYDEWYKTFEGAVEHSVDWQLLERYLPESRDARILDAAGGTGRIAVPLAHIGYSVTLCDISRGMLDVARRKILKQGLTDRLRVVECDIRHLPFPDESFDFVVCWNGSTEASEELIRVTKRTGWISVFLVNRWAAAIRDFRSDPASVLSLCESSAGYAEDDGVKYRTSSTEEALEFFQNEGVEVADIYAVCGWIDVLAIPEGVARSRTWDEVLFRQTVEMVLKLAKEPSVRGLSRHLVVYGRKR